VVTQKTDQARPNLPHHEEPSPTSALNGVCVSPSAKITDYVHPPSPFGKVANSDRNGKLPVAKMSGQEERPLPCSRPKGFSAFDPNQTRAHLRTHERISCQLEYCPKQMPIERLGYTDDLLSLGQLGKGSLNVLDDPAAAE
jgi:hypothetical protein